MTKALLSLRPSDLRALSAGIRSGRLSPPYAPSSAERFLSGSDLRAVSDALNELATAGLTPKGLALALEMLAASVESRPALEDVIDLVTTSADGTRVANRDTGVVVSELFRGARKSVLVAGYAVYQGKRVFRALAERMTEIPALEVRMFLDIQRAYGDTSATEELVRRFLYRFRTAEWPGDSRMPEIFFDPRALSAEKNDRAALHAKCVVVDGKAVFVSSANFTDAAQQRNIEVGLLLRSAQVAGRLSEFFAHLVNRGQLRRAT